MKHSWIFNSYFRSKSSSTYSKFVRK